MHFHTTNLHLTATKMFQHNSVVISDHLVVFFQDKFEDEAVPARAKLHQRNVS